MHWFLKAPTLSFLNLICCHFKNIWSYDETELYIEMFCYSIMIKSSEYKNPAVVWKETSEELQHENCHWTNRHNFRYKDKKFGHFNKVVEIWQNLRMQHIYTMQLYQLLLASTQLISDRRDDKHISLHGGLRYYSAWADCTDDVMRERRSDIRNKAPLHRSL